MTAVGSVADMALERTVTTMTYRVLMVACLMLSTLSMPGRTDASPITIYSNFGPGLAHDSAQANPVGFDFFTGDTDAQGASFAANVDAILTSVAVALSGFSGTNAAPVTVALRSDLGGLPDGILETFSIPAASLGPFGVANAPFVVTSLLHPVLTSSQRYWVTIGGTPTDAVAWNLSSVGASDPTATSVDNGVSWQTLGLTPGAFEVNGDTTQVPEPATIVLLGSGAMVLVRRRFSR
jgi:hypothetical protein